MANVGVLGAGSWGTALSVLLHDNGHEVTIWSIDQKEVEMLNTKREHESKLPGVKLAKEIVITNELNNAMERISLFLQFLQYLQEQQQGK